MRSAVQIQLLLSLPLVIACGNKGTLDTSTDGVDTDSDTDAGPNTEPVAVNDSAETWPGLDIEIDVLDNDSDDDGDTLEISEVTQPENGFVAIDTNGTDSIEYTPDDTFVGVDTFTYTMHDGNGGSDSATVSVNVTDAPTLIITAPADDEVVDGSEITIEFEVDGCNVSSPSSDADGCHLHKYLDSKAYTAGDGMGHYDAGSFTITASDGGHIFELFLVTNDGSDAKFDPVITDSVTFTAEVSDTGDTGSGYKGSSDGRSPTRGWRIGIPY